MLGLDWNTPYLIFEWINIIALVGSVIFLTYAVSSAIIYLVIQRNTSGTGIGDKAKMFTGLDETTDRSAVVKVAWRLILSIVITAILITNTHVYLMGAVYNFIIQIGGTF